MKKILEKSKCTGCTACVSICPTQAITMKTDKTGFKYPVINQTKCIDCGLCKKTCPVINTESNSALNICYGAYCKDEKYLSNSSSGGIFPLIADMILKENGIVIGAAFTENNELKHIAVSSETDLIKLKGSKYLQSDLHDIFTFIRKNVSNKKILFVGTPCQVAGLKRIVKNNQNLLCIDLICHGVPSPKLFAKYIKELETKYNDKLVMYDFRDKTTGWDTYSNTANFKTKKKTELQIENKYMKLFLSNIALRESCFNCNFKLGNKYSDLTLGDYWGVQKYYPNMYNKNGVSAIIVNTDQGREIIDKIKSQLKYQECKLEEILEGNESLRLSSKKPLKWEKFFQEIDSLSIDKLSKKYIKRKSLIKKSLGKIKKIVKKIINKCD